MSAIGINVELYVNKLKHKSLSLNGKFCMILTNCRKKTNYLVLRNIKRN